MGLGVYEFMFGQVKHRQTTLRQARRTNNKKTKNT
jgi:hypothetical protein